MKNSLLVLLTVILFVQFNVDALFEEFLDFNKECLTEVDPNETVYVELTPLIITAINSYTEIARILSDTYEDFDIEAKPQD